MSRASGTCGTCLTFVLLESQREQVRDWRRKNIAKNFSNLWKAINLQIWEAEKHPPPPKKKFHANSHT